MAILRLDRLGPGAAALLRALGAPPGAALVGGAIRDVVLRRTEADPSRDIDIAVPSGALELARRCAERLRGTCVVLDAERGAARVIADGGLTLDLTDFRGPSLEADLAARDFTVDALAVPLGMLVTRGRGDARHRAAAAAPLRRARALPARGGRVRPAARPPGRAGPVWRGAGRARGRAARRRRAAGSGPEAGRAAARRQQARDATAHRRARAVLRARRDRRAPRPRARRAPAAARARDRGRRAPRASSPAADAPGPRRGHHAAGALPLLPRPARGHARSLVARARRRGRGHRRLAARHLASRGRRARALRRLERAARGGDAAGAPARRGRDGALLAGTWTPGRLVARTGARSAGPGARAQP